MLRLLAVVYGLVAYFIGVIGLACIILVLAKLVPWGFLSDVKMSQANAIMWNILLVALWGVIHTVMARPAFKRILTRFIAEGTERSTYVLVAGVTSVLLTGYWQAVDGYVWSFDHNLLVTTLWAVFIFGWLFLLSATFAINHFDLFGLRQVYFYYKNLPRPPLHFVKRAMYKYIRHPIQTGVLIGVWATPVMSNTQVVLSLGFTVYIFIGLWFEERDLVEMHGDEYVTYRQQTGKVLPKWSS